MQTAFGFSGGAQVNKLILQCWDSEDNFFYVVSLSISVLENQNPENLHQGCLSRQVQMDIIKHLSSEGQEFIIF